MRYARLVLTVLALLLWRYAAAATPPFDLVIRHACIVDGSGKPGFSGEVGIKAGKIAFVGEKAGAAGAVEIDAHGLVVCPGFIDVHTHVDGDILKWPEAENFIRDGVTTIVAGNCGSSVRNVRAYLEQVNARGSAVNVATLVGHNTILERVKGDKAGDLTPQQMDRAKAMVRQAMWDGAVGMSTGLIYTPGQFSKTAEIVELQKVAAQFGGIYATHMRSEGAEIMSAIDEAITIGRAARCRVEISHFKLPADVSRRIGGSDATLKRVIDARLAGLEVWLDQYPYTASSTTISTLIPDEFLAEGTDAARNRLKDPREVERLISAMRKLHETQRGRKSLAFAVVSFSEGYPQLAGRNIVQIAQIFNLKQEKASQEELDRLRPDQLPPVTMEDQYRAIIALFSAGSTQCVFHTMSEDDVENIMRNPLVSIARDSGIREFGVGMPHPRGYGTCARVLGHYVRERRVLPLEEAVRKMTSLPALAMRFTDRGMLREGLRADVVIFDPQSICDKATFERPHQYSQGIEWVIVNGKIVMAEGKLTGQLPGRAIFGPGYDPARRAVGEDDKNEPGRD